MNNKKVKEKTILFKDYPEFRPNLTPRKIFLLGSFGGTYWRPITSKVTNKSYKNQHKEFPKSWWKGIPNKWLTSPVCNVSINNYGVKSGTSLRFWEKKGWMNKQDPYGWVQWYCRFYKGRRTPDDKRQIKRWLAFAGPKGRFKRRLVNMIKNKKTKYNDYTVSPVIRQGLQHWAYRLVPGDVRKKPVKKRNFGKWSLKYKRSINCKRPKGFSQKQYCKRKRKFGKKTFLYNPNNPKTSFDVYINKNPKDTIPIKYTTVKDVQDTIRKLERLYKAKKYPHTRIWKVGMILKVRLEAMVKHTGKKKTHFKHSKNYFHFLGQRTTKKEPERRKMVFKFNKTYRKVNKVKRKRKYGKTLLPKLRKISKKNVKHIYKLKDPHKKRILAIDEGIRAEAKKTGRTMKKAAIAKKARFNVLRIYRKNRKLGECNKLTRDMRYIDKKYKLGKTKNICKRKKKVKRRRRFGTGGLGTVKTIPHNMFTEIVNSEGTYNGQIKDGKRHGLGKMIYSDGDVYEGYWKDDELHGKGKFVWDNGDVYEGDFLDGLRHGKGKIKYYYGSEYEGGWNSDKYQGYGKYTDPNGNIYKGNFENGLKHGKGEMQYSNGDFYYGNWENNYNNGQGVMRYHDKSIYVGNWEDCEYNGEGTYFDVEGEKKIIKKGTWALGSHINGDIYTYEDRKFTHKIITESSDNDQYASIVTSPSGYIDIGLKEFEKISKPRTSEAFGKRRKKRKK